MMTSSHRDAPCPSQSRHTSEWISAVAPLALYLLVLASGCAASSKAPEAASEPAASPPQYSGEASSMPTPSQPYPGAGPQDPNSEFDQSEAQLMRALVGTKEIGAEPQASPDRCEQVCKALGSMRRAADGVCSLDTSRCDDVRARLKKAQERAEGACPACVQPPT